MPISFLNVTMLAGLAAIALPPIIHLLARRKFDISPWGAMQFLDLGKRTRRRIIWDELLLMAVRMGLIGVLVLALAGPVETAGWLARFQPRGERDIVLVLDNSASMAIGIAPGAAKSWAMKFIDDLGPGDRLAVIHAGQAPKLISSLSTDRETARTVIQSLPSPRGGCDGPGAVALARQTLAESRSSERIIVIISDGQRYGWADDTAAQRWDLQSSSSAETSFAVALARLALSRSADTPRWSLEPLRTSRALAVTAQPVTLRSGLRRLGSGELPVPTVHLEIDGQELGITESAEASASQTVKPIDARHTFTTAGSHLMTLRVVSADRIELDRRDLALDVVTSLPVLLIDGDERSNNRDHGVEFLREALAPARDPSPGVVVRVVPIGAFEPALLTRDLRGPQTEPRVLVLVDCPRLSAARTAAVERFLESGGGVLVTLGDRADAEHYTHELHRAGRGWLPAAVGLQAGPGDPGRAPQVLTASFVHPALELFRGGGPGTLAEWRVPRWRTLTIAANGKAAAIARLSGDVPLFVEAPYGRGRVIVSAVPLDDSGGTNLVELPSFAPLVHELATYLSRARAGDSPAGQPIRWELPKSMPTEGWQLFAPNEAPRPVSAANGQIVIENPREPGVYALTHPSSPPRYYVIEPDSAENDLSPLDATDESRLTHWLPGLLLIQEPTDAIRSLTTASPTEIGPIALGAVIALLTLELWLTRQRAVRAVETQ